MKGATGCYSEHTAEYVLVRSIRAILVERFDSVCPFYFWTRREGTKLSQISGPSEEVRILAIFPRRPRMLAPLADLLVVHLDRNLCEFSEQADRVGIPVIAGVPLARSLFEIGATTDCVWFRISPNPLDCLDVELQLDMNGQVINGGDASSASWVTLNGKEIQEMLLSNATRMKWPEAIRAVEQARGSFRHRFWGGARKPFYVACHDC